MDELQRRAVLLALINELHRVESWCGETHIQKCIYFGQELFHLETNFAFELYKHGPFSFELRDELSSMQADEILGLQIQPPPYGPSIMPGPLARRLLARFPKTIGRVETLLRLLAKEFGGRGAGELERLSTAFYIARELNVRNVEARAKMLTRLKPHIDLDEAREATGAIDKLLETLSATR